MLGLILSYIILQGTVGLELLQQVPDLDAILIPCSGGGLSSGIAIATKAISPKTKGQYIPYLLLGVLGRGDKKEGKRERGRIGAASFKTSTGYLWHYAKPEPVDSHQEALTIASANKVLSHNYKKYKMSRTIVQPPPPPHQSFLNFSRLLFVTLG